MADSENTQTAAEATTRPQPAASEQIAPPPGQVISKIPTTWPAKSEKRVATGKAVAERTRQAREAQKKAAEAAVAAGLVPPFTGGPASGAGERKNHPSAESSGGTNEDTKNVIITTQWLSIISILVSLIGLYYKREEIKKGFQPAKLPKRSASALPSSATPPRPADSRTSSGEATLTRKRAPANGLTFEK